jgi:CBS domain-containing protein
MDTSPAAAAVTVGTQRPALTPIADDLMHSPVITVGVATPLRAAARLMLTHGIGALVVCDAAGAPVGMLSDGDLLGRDAAEHLARRDWWLALVADSQPDHPALLPPGIGERQAETVMSAPIVTADVATPAPVLARLLLTHRIKRVPVLRNGVLVGIVGHADLLGVLCDLPEATALPAPEATGGLVRDLLESLFHVGPTALRALRPPPADMISPLSADAFRGLVGAHDRSRRDTDAASRRAADLAHRREVKTLLAAHLDDELWQMLLDHARAAAEHGEVEFLMLEFPSGLCSDGGRAINLPAPEWSRTLRGEAADLYMRWQRELQPQGFGIAARVLNYPGGKPGDIGLYLTWPG